jgi:hypothetical protein
MDLLPESGHDSKVLGEVHGQYANDTGCVQVFQLTQLCGRKKNNNNNRLNFFSGLKEEDFF